MDLNILIFKLEKSLIDRRDIPKLRGFIADKYPQYVELHNHIENRGYKYGYPVIQYKVIDKTPALIAINEACSLLMKVSFELKNINIGSKEIDINEKEYVIKKEKLGISEDLIDYDFISPWMALNQDNYKKYLSFDKAEKENLLKRILIGNVLSMSKSLSYSVEEEIKTQLDLEPCKVNFKNQTMIAFKGKFKINFHIPDYLGLGKSVSRGFGTVRKLYVDKFEL